MIGSCYIDGIDIDRFGAFIMRGGDFDFLSFPERKPPYSNDWYEENGVEYDLSEVYFKEKKVTVKFHFSAPTGVLMVSALASFRSLIASPGEHSIYMRDFDRMFNLRYVSCSSYRHRGGLAKVGDKKGDLSVVFSMDNPLQFFAENIVNPIGNFNNETHIKISGVDLARYGIIVNECYNTTLAYPAVKTPLTRSFANAHGIEVAKAKELVYKEKKVVISCTMRADTKEQLYTNYIALFNALRVPGLLTLTTFSSEEYCFYSQMQNFKKLRPLSIRPLISFNIVLTCVDSGQVIFLLASEDGRLIETETGSKFIDMQYYGHS